MNKNVLNLRVIKFEIKEIKKKNLNGKQTYGYIYKIDLDSKIHHMSPI